jgi:hypothetical protein
MQFYALSHQFVRTWPRIAYEMHIKNLRKCSADEKYF